MLGKPILDLGQKFANNIKVSTTDYCHLETGRLQTFNINYQKLISHWRGSSTRLILYWSGGANFLRYLLGHGI